MDAHGSTDIRAALDRLQGAFDLLGDRYRELRRERKLLHDQIDDERRRREEAEFSLLAIEEKESGQRAQIESLTTTQRVAEDRAAELHNRVVELEEELRRRDAMILQLEDAARTHEAAVERERSGAEEARSLWETGERESAELRAELDRRAAEIEELRTALNRAESELATRGDNEEIDEIRREIATWSARYEHEREERHAVEERQLQTIAKLDAATRAEAEARTAAARAVAELETAQNEREAAVNEQTLLREMLRDVELLRTHAETERERAERAESRVTEREAELMAERERAAALERERDEWQTLMESEGETASTLRARMEESERLRTEALDRLAAIERTGADVDHDREVMARQIAVLTEEIATLRSASNGTAHTVTPEQGRQIVEQIDAALRLIDEQLGEGAQS